MPGGRPNKYDEKYCEMLIEHMAEGLSYESFGGVIRVCRATLYNWEKEHSEFLDAKKVGQEMSFLFWDKLMRAQSLGEIKGNASSAIFTMKNRFGWTDKQEITETSNESKLIIELTEKE